LIIITMASPPSTVLYLAYGSMCNRTSLERRGLFPSVSAPAVLPGWTLRFDNTGGMADVLHGLPPTSASSGEEDEKTHHGPVYCVPTTAATLNADDADGNETKTTPPPYLHGVLHSITEKEWETLAAIEAVYSWRELPVIPYGPRAAALIEAAAAARGGGALSSVLARVFIGNPEAKTTSSGSNNPSHAHELPTDRYVGIICAGLEEHGADEGWVACVRRVPCEKTPGPGEHRRLPGFLTREEEMKAMADDSAPLSKRLLPRRSRAWLRQREGVVDPNVTFALGARIFRAKLAPSAPFRPIVERMIAGREAAVGFCLNLYDPRLPELGAVDPETGTPSLGEVHVAYAEDHFAKMLASRMGSGDDNGGAGLAFGGGIRHVGWLVRDGEENDDDEEAEDEEEER
jgi:hypothetical protein